MEIKTSSKTKTISYLLLYLASSLTVSEMSIRLTVVHQSCLNADCCMKLMTMCYSEDFVTNIAFYREIWLFWPECLFRPDLKVDRADILS